MNRWIAFLLAIILGIAAGLYYGWVISPVEYVDTTPDTLRVDYKTDFVLMVAEVYQANGNIEIAVQRLALLGDDTPLDLTQQAYEYAQDNGYGQTDLNLLTQLHNGIQNRNPADPALLEEGGP